MRCRQPGRCIEVCPIRQWRGPRGLQLAKDSSHIPVISDKEGFHPYLKDKVNILYADGHATKDVKFFTGN